MRGKGGSGGARRREAPAHGRAPGAPERVYLGLGSNLDDREENIRTAARLLAPHCDELKLSRLYQTEPWGLSSQPRFLNAAASCFTKLEPAELLVVTQGIERELGRDRDRETRWGPRTIDIDILLYGARVSEESAPILPHPRMAERAFVLVPLLDLAPGLIDPRTGEPYATVLERIGRAGVYEYPAG